MVAKHVIIGRPAAFANEHTTLFAAGGAPAALCFYPPRTLIWMLLLQVVIALSTSSSLGVFRQTDSLSTLALDQLWQQCPDGAPMLDPSCVSMLAVEAAPTATRMQVVPGPLW